MDGCLLRVQLRATLRSVVLIGFQLATGKHFDLVGSAFGDGVSPLGYRAFLDAQSISNRGFRAEVVNGQFSFHAHLNVRSIEQVKTAKLC
jgi:hypothetical protein